MFAYIEGKLTHLNAASAIIDVNGVGYEFRISLQTYSVLQTAGEKCRLFTFLSIREDAHLLFGFATPDEKHLFLDLLSVSGIGANTALMMLSSLNSQEIRQAIVSEDVRTIQSIKGIGAKTAQRAILELKDKFKKDNMLGNNVPLMLVPSQNMAVRNEALAALVVLGIPKAIAEKSIDVILKKSGDDITIEQLIKMALR